MKKVILILILGALVSCADEDSSGGPCNGSILLGTWSSGNNRIEFRPNCTGYASFCQSEFMYENTTSQSGVVSFNSFNGNGRYCSHNGRNACHYQKGERGLYLTCGYAMEYFTRL